MSGITFTEESWERFMLICKPEQSGKTFVMIQQIIKDFTEPCDGKEVINFIFCDNNLLLTKQTSERVKNDLKEIVIHGESYVEFSSRNDGVAKRDKAAVGWAITGPSQVRNVICCTNGKRVSDITSIIEDFNRCSMWREKFVFKIWLDEADKFDKFIAKKFIPLIESHNNVQIFCLTATPKTLFDKFKHMNVMPIEKTTSPHYHGWEDNKRTIIDNTTFSTEGFIHHVLTENSETIKAGTKWYIPAERKKVSHRTTRDILVKKGFAVFVVNGDGLELTLPNKPEQSMLEGKTEQLNTQIMRLYRENNLEQFPVAITGNVCIGRGISIMSPDFIFDYGILSSCKKLAEASQNAGRLKGNIKGWDNYKAPRVFTTEEFNRVATEWEQKSRRLAEMAFEKQEAGESTVMSKTAFKTMGQDYEYIKHTELFSTIKEVRAFLGRVKSNMGLEDTYTPRLEGFDKHKKKCGGYSVTSKLLSKGMKATDLTADDRITIEKANQISEGACISTKKGSRFLVLPVYESMDTPADQVQYQVRYLNVLKN